MGDYAISTVPYLAEIFHRFSLQIESAAPVRFCLRKNCPVPSGRMFSPVFPKIETAISLTFRRKKKPGKSSSRGRPAV